MPRPPRAFRLQAKNLFITYPHCSLDKNTALDQIKLIQCSSNKKYIRVARELHENGEPHLHVLLQFEGKVQIYNPRHFDLIHPHTSAVFHPNLQGAKSSTDVKRYIEKDGDYTEWGDFQIDGRSARGGQQTANDAYAQALNTGNKQLALDTIRELAPKDFVLQFHNLNANLDRIFAPPLEVFVSPFLSSSFNTVPDTLEEWVSENIMDSAARPYRPISLVIEGDSRTGKTMWARSLGPHNYLCGHLDLSPKVYSNSAWYNVIDDVDPHYLKHFKEFMGAQRDWQSNTKYGKPIQIKGGIPTIFLCNPGPSSSYKEFLDEEKHSALKAWATKNALFVDLHEPLFTAQSSQENQNNTTQED